MCEVRRDRKPAWLVAVESMSPESRRRQQGERAQRRCVEQTGVDGRERRGRASGNRDHDCDLEHVVVPRAGGRCPEECAAAEEGDEQREEDQLRQRDREPAAERAARLEAEHGSAAGGQQPEEIQRPLQHAGPAAVRRCVEQRRRRRASRADREREYAALRVPVVGDDAPAHAVVAVGEPAERQDEVVPVHGRRPGEDRSSRAVRDRGVAFPGADRVVEEDRHVPRSRGQHGPVCGRRAEERRVCVGSCWRGE